MLKSMTGFGQCQVEDSFGTQVWEIRSVNSKYLDVKWRLPNHVKNMEVIFDKILRQHANRGRLEIALTIQANSSKLMLSKFDQEAANALLDTLNNFAISRGDNYSPDYNALLKLGLLWENNNDELNDDLSSKLEQAFITALSDWNESRKSEAINLARDINSRLLKLEEWISLIEDRAPQIKETRVEQLKDRLNEALNLVGTELDESRFLQEIVILSDKLDVSEELTRLRSHLERLGELVNGGVDAGRRLEFTLQECFREINTCGNKIQDSQISRIVVDFKNELEKCKEQALNLE